MNFLILAAGKGSKIWPYNEIREKTLIPVSGKPLVSWLINNIIQTGVHDISLAVRDDAYNDFSYTFNKLQEIKSLIKNEQFNIIKVKDSTGPACTLQQMSNEHHFSSETSIVINGDCYIDPKDINSLIHCKSKFAILFSKLNKEEFSDRIAFNVNYDFEFKYHPRSDGYEYEIVAFKVGNDFFDSLSNGLANIYSHIQCGMMPSNEHFIEPLLFDWSQSHKAQQLYCQCEVVNVDYPWDILKANLLINNKRCSALTKNTIGENSSISDRAILRGYVSLGKNSYIGDNVIINGNIIVGDNTKVTDGAILGSDIVIGDNCQVKEYCKIFSDSTIGNNCLIGHGAELEGIILDKTYLYHYCEIFGILGYSVDIGAGTAFGTLRFDDAKPIHNINGRRITPSEFGNAIYIGDFVRTGVNTTIMPGVKVGNRSVISANVSLSSDLASNKIVMLKQELIERDWGDQKYGI